MSNHLSMDMCPYHGSMTVLFKMLVQSDNYIGGPGVNVFYFTKGTPPMDDETAVQDAYDMLHASFEAIAVGLAPGIRLVVGTEATQIDAETGEVVGVTPVTTSDTDISGSGTGGLLPRGTSLCMRHSTGLWQNSKQLVGRSFIGPIAGGSMTTAGQIEPTFGTLVENDFNGLISGVGARLAVWHRPAVGTHTGGYYADVVRLSVNSVPSTLRSRNR